MKIFSSESESRSCGGGAGLGAGGGAAAAAGGGGGGAQAAGGGSGGAGPPAAASGSGDDVELLPPLHSHPDSHLAAQQTHQPVTIENTATNTSSQSFKSQLTVVAIILSSSIKKALLKSNHSVLYYDKQSQKFT